MDNNFRYGADRLTVKKALNLARGKIMGVLTEETKLKIKESFNAVQSIAKGDQLIYSINTGFGPLCTTKISMEETGILQETTLVQKR